MNSERARTPSRRTWTAVLVGLTTLVSPSAAQNDPAPATALELVGDGARAFVAGDLDTAESHFEEALEQAPGLLPGFLGLLEIYKARGDWTQALDMARRAKEANPDAAQAQAAVVEMEVFFALREVQALATARRFDEAFEALNPVLAAMPDLVAALELKAKLLLAMARPREALSVALAAREGAPESARLLFLEGLVRSSLGQAVEAESPLRRALELDPDLGDAHSMLGSSLSRQKRPAEAILHFEQAISLGSDSPTLRLGYAAALESLGREEEAQAQMEAYRRLH